MVDVGVGRSVRPLGPLTWTIAAPPDVVFDVIADPYLRRTPRALREKLEVWERGRDMVIAAHFTPTRVGTATTVEAVRFDRASRIDFRLLRGPVPHVAESFVLRPADGGTELAWVGRAGNRFVGAWPVLGQQGGRRVGGGGPELDEGGDQRGRAAHGARAAMTANP